MYMLRLFIDIDSDGFPFRIVKLVHGFHVGQHAEAEEQDDSQKEGADNSHPYHRGEKRNAVPTIRKLALLYVEWLKLKN